MKVLVTGGAGYIGATVCSALVDNGMRPVIIDDLSSGDADFILTHPHHLGDFADTRVLDALFDEHGDIEAVVHCAAKISVPESLDRPLSYYEQNVGRTIRLLDALAARGIHRFVFSSSAAVYGADAVGRITEEHPTSPAGPYAWTKLMGEQVLRDVCRTTTMRSVALRYFNPVGADPKQRSGRIIDTVSGNVLDQLMISYRTGREFVVYGDDWPTRDGTPVRDFVHVYDLAEAHVKALMAFDDLVSSPEGSATINLGSNTGTTILELIDAFEQVCQTKLKVRMGERRPGDSAGGFADPTLARQKLGWQASRSVTDALHDAIRWDSSSRIVDRGVAAA